ncbi:hypothetical protein GQ43DRAFT_385257 [Delitschia confertaspora ATCC 74209]|uniref:C3H1-type domain-containing protein n=1 Tax=Delitschia confertaspora ATCC 74209 TaxID=1513339 RepID=A0A9P4MX46_9PLEO|nr:hypothetical protein GQ43DRAFT_385257 [Delitschia confertaspora ATCC 74209]
MHLDETETAAFKDWVITKLEKISDADAEVLADYVIALVRADDPDEVVRQNCLESLPDFLNEHTAPFVEDTFSALRTKSYQAPPQTQSKPLSAEARPFNPPAGPSVLPHKPANAPLFQNYQNVVGAPTQTQKRGFHDRDTSEHKDGRDPHYSRNAGERSHKQMRRGGRTGRGGFSGQDMNMGPQPGFPGMSTSMGAAPIAAATSPSNAFNAFDPTNPMASFMAMQAMGLPFPPMPPIPMPPMPISGPSPSFTPSGFQAQPASARKERCQNYDTKGFCIMGSVCPFEHGAAPIVVPTEEYDPNKSSLAVAPTLNSNGSEQAASIRGERGRGRGLGRGRGERGAFRAGRPRAPFSQLGPTTDPSNTTVVVEQIPEEKFDEQSVRGFFSEFGTILDVQMQAYKRLAIVKFEDHFSARKAYDSPKAIFDNRFVKVYWYKPETIPTPPTQANETSTNSPPADTEAYAFDEELVDIADVEKRQAEAQKVFEEKQKKIQEAEAQLEEVQKKLKAADEEKTKLLEKLAAKTARKGASNGDGEAEPDVLTRLATLHAEAQHLESSPIPQPSFVRDSYRGRGTFVARGRGYPSPSYRGGFYHGRGNFTGPPTKKLDNRPKKVAISGVEVGSRADEALRQHLLSVPEFDIIEEHPDRKDTQIVAFKERYAAETFIEAASDIPDIGKVELSWVVNAPPPSKNVQVLTPTATVAPTATAAPTDTPMKNNDMVTDNDKKTDGQPTKVPEQMNGNGDGNVHGQDADYDVADDEDRWMAE